VNRLILIVDDEESIRWTLKKALEREGYRILLARDGGEGVKLAQDPAVDLVLLDLRLPMMDGLEVLTRIKEERPELPIIIMTAYGTLPAAVQAMKRGAYDYITKPFDVEELLLQVERAFQVQALSDEVVRLRENLREQFDFGGVVGQSPPMQEVFKLVGKVAASDITVLLRGESGTGKELIARAIHYHSKRFGRPFVAVNCAAIPKELLESELFGHEKGAFTGATSLKRGKFELAHGGTLFLDEIGDMDLTLQTKILRVLQEKEVERVGGEGPLAVDVRIIAASNQDLEAAVARKTFREDLFYRLNVVTIHLPPLRERREDIPLLVGHFLRQYAKEHGEEPKVFSSEALELLFKYPWPGNVRELENVVKRACVLSTTPLILPEHLPPHLLTGRQPERAMGLEEMLARGVTALLQNLRPAEEGKLYSYFLSLLERPLFTEVLRRTRGNQVEAARLLGINRNTLRKRLRALGIEPPRPSRKR